MGLLNSIGYKLTLAVSKMMGNGVTVSGDTNLPEEIALKFQGLMHTILGPVLIVLGAAAGIYLVYLGVLYAKAEDGSKRKEVQGRLIGAAIGLVIIIVGITLVYAIDWKSVWEGLGATAPKTE